MSFQNHVILQFPTGHSDGDATHRPALGHSPVWSVANDEVWRVKLAEAYLKDTQQGQPGKIQSMPGPSSIHCFVWCGCTSLDMHYE